MTDSHDDAVIETPKKNKGGRPRKVKPVESSDVMATMAAMANQIANLQSALLQQGAQMNERQQATLTPIPQPSEALPSGSYIKQGVDSSGAPIMGKVRWTKQAIDATYPQVTFTPMRDFTCGPHGIIYRVEPGRETTVPQIVKDLYDESLRIEREMTEKYKPWTAAERSDIDSRAAEQPGVGIKSRLARVGAGLNVHAADAAANPEIPAQ